MIPTTHVHVPYEPARLEAFESENEKAKPELPTISIIHAGILAYLHDMYAINTCILNRSNLVIYASMHGGQVKIACM